MDDSFVIKAQRVPYGDFKHPVASSISKEMQAQYDARMDEMEEAIEGILSETTAKSLVFNVPSLSLRKAMPGISVPKAPKAPGAPTPKAAASAAAKKKREEVKHPGAKGGKFYRTKSGKIVYGTQPMPQLHEREATGDEIAEHVQKQLSPTVFLGHTAETVAALRDSGEFEEHQLDTIEIIRNQMFLPMLEELGISEKETDAHVKIKNALGKGQHQALGAWMKQFFVDNLVAANPEKNTEESVTELWEELHEKYRKAAFSPKVQEALKQRALEYEEQVNKYNYDVENTKASAEELHADMVHGTNSQDTSLSSLMLMRDMGTLFVPGKGQTKRKSKSTNGTLHLKGTIQPDTEYLGSLSLTEDSERGKPTVNLSRMNDAQLSSLFVAATMAATRDAGGTFDTGDAWNANIRDAGGDHTLAEEKIRQAITERLGDKPKAEVDFHFARLREMGKQIADAANKFNTGELTGLDSLFDADAPSMSKDEISKLRQKIADQQAEREEILKSQLDTSMTVDGKEGIPDAMKGGYWDGMEITDPVTGEKKKSEAKPFTYQAQAINWICKAKRGILGYFAGAGKTACLIGASTRLMQEGKIKRSMLFLPPVLMAQWPNEIKTYAPGIKDDEVLDLSPFSLEERKLMLKSKLAQKAKFIIMSTGTLSSPIKEGEEPQPGQDENGGMDNDFVQLLNGLEGMVIADEVHSGGFKGGAEDIGRASVRHRLLSQVMKDREYAVGITATAMPNSPIDTYHLSNLFAPGKAGSLDQWSGTLSNTVYDPVTGKRTVAFPDKLKELRKRMKPTVFVKKVTDEEVKKQIGKWLPPAPSQVRHEMKPSTEIGQNGLSQADYFKEGGGIDRIAGHRVEELAAKYESENGEEMPEATKKMIHRLLKTNLSRQAAISPALIDPKYGLDAPAPKIDHAVKTILDHFGPTGHGNNGQPIVVFASTVKSFELMKRRLKQQGLDVENQTAEISEKASGDDRAYIQDATNQGKIKVLFVGIKSGGAGVNLQKAANHMLFLDNPWTPADKTQAIGRVWRVGQTQNVNITSMSMEGTMDPLIEEKIANKETVSESLLGDDDTWDDDAHAKILQLLGGKSPEESPETKARKAKGKGKKDRITKKHDNAFKEIASSLAPGTDIGAQLLRDQNLTDVELNKKARERLPVHLRQEFDQAAHRKEWREKKAQASIEARIKGLESLLEATKAELDPNHPDTKEAVADLTTRLKNLQSKAGKQVAVRSTPTKETAPSSKPSSTAKPKSAPKLPGQTKTYRPPRSNDPHNSYQGRSYFARSTDDMFSEFMEPETGNEQVVLDAHGGTRNDDKGGTWDAIREKYENIPGAANIKHFEDAFRVVARASAKGKGKPDWRKFDWDVWRDVPGLEKLQKPKWLHDSKDDQEIQEYYAQMQDAMEHGEGKREPDEEEVPF